MIALNTNVVSELMKKSPDGAVLAWAGGLPDEELAMPAVVAAELLRGLDRLPGGARRATLERALDALFSRLGPERVLDVNTRSAVEFATVMTVRERVGRPMSMMDALIAATCRAHDARLATRNTRDFLDTGIRLLDPWHGDGVTTTSGAS